MNVLVTGHQGYIGGYTVKALEAAGHSPKFFNEPVEAIIHLGALIDIAESVRDPSRYYHFNVIESIQLLDAAVEHHVKYFVFASSAAQSGSPYGLGKRFIEDVLASYDHAYGLKYVALRYFNVAGGNENHEPETHLIPNLMRAAKLGTPMPIYGDGSQIRDYVHVEDVALANIKALEYLKAGGQSRTLDIGTGCGWTVKEVIAKAETISSRSIKHQRLPERSGDSLMTYADTEPADRILGWKAKRPLDYILESAWRATCEKV